MQNATRDGAALAFDRASVRDFDADGRLHVAVSNISKAAVNPYLGREIPGWRDLGLAPDKVYRLYRDPEELAKSAKTFDNLPVLSEHQPVTADSHKPSLVIGSTGTDAEFDAPFLKNSLVIWARAAIDAIEDEAMREISCGYRYRPDMTPGTAGGEPYDGVMRDIVGNHVAIVREGRAGPEVIVGDTNEEISMAMKAQTRKAALVQGASLAFLVPKLASDEMPDLAPAFRGVTAKNYAVKKPMIVAAITKATDGFLAQDASLDGLNELLDKFDDQKPIEDEEPAPDKPSIPERKDEAKTGEDAGEDVLSKLSARLDAIEAAVAKMTRAERAEAEENLSEDEDDDEKEDENMVTRPAMDAAIAAAVRAANAQAAKTREAERAVRPYVGELGMSFDTADAVYEAALKTLGIETKGVHPSAYPTILAMQPKPGSKRQPATIAQDAAAGKTFADRFPDAARVRII